MGSRLDPDAQRLLEEWAAASNGPIEQQPVEALRNSGLINHSVTGPPPELALVSDRAVESSGSERIPIRVYSETVEAGAPVIVYGHGGGWTLLSIDAADVLCRHIARGTGCTVVSVGYRLAPEHPFPAAFDDMWDVTAWAADGGLGWQPPKVCVAGDSAGANLAAAVALHATRTGRVSIDLQLLLYPATSTDVDTESMRTLGSDPRFRLTPAVMRWAWHNYVGADLSSSDYRAVPARAGDFSGVARAIVVTPEFDPIKDDGRSYAELLRNDGVQVDLISPAGLPHGFGMMLGAVPGALPALEDVIARARDVMRPLPPPATELSSAGVRSA